MCDMSNLDVTFVTLKDNPGLLNGVTCHTCPSCRHFYHSVMKHLYVLFSDNSLPLGSYTGYAKGVVSL